MNIAGYPKFLICEGIIPKPHFFSPKDWICSKLIERDLLSFPLKIYMHILYAQFLAKKEKCDLLAISSFRENAFIKMCKLGNVKGMKSFLEMVIKKHGMEEGKRVANGTFNYGGDGWMVEDATCLHFAAKEGYLEVVKYLLKIDGIQVNIPNGSNKTPLHCAAEKGYLKVVKSLMEDSHLTKEEKKKFFMENDHFGDSAIGSTRNEHLYERLTGVREVSHTPISKLASFCTCTLHMHPNTQYLEKWEKEFQ